MAAYQARIPKYIEILNSIRDQIESGVYRPGDALPSESQIGAAFGVSRPTVLKALAFLKQDGTIESMQGKASYVRARPTARRLPGDRQARTVATRGELVSVAPVLASGRIASALAVEDGTPVYRRICRTLADGVPVELAVMYLPVEVAVGSDATKPESIPGGMLAHLAARKQIHADYTVEQVTARMPTAEEAGLLDIPADEPVLAVVTTVCTATGAPVLVVVVIMPGFRHEIEHARSLG